MGKQIRLKPEVKIYLMQGLARYMTPSQVRDAIKAEFDLEIGLPTISFYDPTKGDLAKKRLSKHLVEIFEETRQSFRKTTAEHAISDIGYRIGRLQRMSEQAERNKNLPLAAQLLEQAAKDIGGVFTNQRKLEIAPENEQAKQAFAHFRSQHPDLSEEECRDLLSSGPNSIPVELMSDKVQ